MALACRWKFPRKYVTHVTHKCLLMSARRPSTFQWLPSVIWIAYRRSSKCFGASHLKEICDVCFFWKWLFLDKILHWSAIMTYRIPGFRKGKKLSTQLLVQHYGLKNVSTDCPYFLFMIMLYSEKADLWHFCCTGVFGTTMSLSARGLPVWNPRSVCISVVIVITFQKNPHQCGQCSALCSCASSGWAEKLALCKGGVAGTLGMRTL